MRRLGPTRMARPAAVALLLFLAGGLDAQAQLFPNRPIERERTPREVEHPTFKQYRCTYWGYHPTCWRRWPEGWGCPSAEAPDFARSLRELPIQGSPGTDDEPSGTTDTPGTTTTEPGTTTNPGDAPPPPLPEREDPLLNDPGMDSPLGADPALPGLDLPTDPATSPAPGADPTPPVADPARRPTSNGGASSSTLTRPRVGAPTRFAAVPTNLPPLPGEYQRFPRLPHQLNVNVPPPATAVDTFTAPVSLNRLRPSLEMGPRPASPTLPHRAVVPVSVSQPEPQPRRGPIAGLIQRLRRDRDGR